VHNQKGQGQNRTYFTLSSDDDLLSSRLHVDEFGVKLIEREGEKGRPEFLACISWNLRRANRDRSDRAAPGCEAAHRAEIKTALGETGPVVIAAGP
jgi:hypothetical protein